MANKYILYLDECGDQNLASFDPQFPIFTLCGIVVSGTGQSVDRTNQCP